MIVWLVEDTVDRFFAKDRRDTVRTAKARARLRGLTQRGWKLNVKEPTKSNISQFLNGYPPIVDQEKVVEVEVFAKETKEKGL